MIGVIDLEISNINSVSRALHYLKIDHHVFLLNHLDGIDRAEKLILPGVGSFFEAAQRIRQSGLDNILSERVLDQKIPILGICLGMQLFASFGEEGGGADGLGWIKANVLLHRARKKGLILPHIGWNDVRGKEMAIFEGTGDSACFYFIHSYEMMLEEKAQTALCHYGEDFVAGVQKGHIVGVQFHPEKSQKVGLKLLQNFCEGKY